MTLCDKCKQRTVEDGECTNSNCDAGEWARKD